jgi:hypothetical protein
LAGKEALFALEMARTAAEVGAETGTLFLFCFCFFIVHGWID